MKRYGVPVMGAGARVANGVAWVVVLVLFTVVADSGQVPWLPVWAPLVVVPAVVVARVAGPVLAFRRFRPENRAAARWVKSARGLSAVLAGSPLAWTETPKGEGAKPIVYVPSKSRPAEVARGVEVAVRALPGKTEDVYRKLVDAMKPVVPASVSGVEYLGAAQGWHSFLLVTVDPLAAVGEAEL